MTDPWVGHFREILDEDEGEMNLRFIDSGQHSMLETHWLGYFQDFEEILKIRKSSILSTFVLKIENPGNRAKMLDFQKNGHEM